MLRDSLSMVEMFVHAYNVKLFVIPMLQHLTMKLPLQIMQKEIRVWMGMGGSESTSQSGQRLFVTTVRPRKYRKYTSFVVFQHPNFL